ncbi:N-acetylmuramoyl-L-alanine amidase [Pontiella sp. NLcol2]|uniref:N-acetylmuramoyl-L-alanine amidase n=2 Tax=Pontiella agarivorans TaxID=3038953 RepID=A0ABU5MSJ7_9BACT|nr:N-acetylmuramoyl-L-alanine amidase [Pontiella agarivorans]
MKISIFGKKIRMENKYNRVEIETNSRRAYVNGVMIWLHEPCRKQSSGWAIREVDFKKGIDPILRTYAYAPKRMPRLVVLDPGHGGKDTGSISPKGYREKDIVLDISHRVRKLLEAKGIRVRMTRTGDTYPQLDARTAYAYKNGADLFVSVHANAAGATSASGVETFITAAAGYDSSNHYGQAGDKFAFKNNTYDALNAALGFSIHSNIMKMTKRDDRGLRRARYSVLKHCSCPAALVECGFLTNPDEESLLNTSSYRESCARGIANGVLGYFTLMKRALR